MVITMFKFFKENKAEIEKYCKENNLSFEKVCKAGQFTYNNDLWLQYVDREKGKNGLLDETPAPVVLRIYLNNNGDLKFEQTEHTKKYLV